MTQPATTWPRKPVGRIRWSIAGLTAFGILINYFDRSNISLAAAPMQKSLHLSVAQYGLVLSAFGWSYAFYQIPFGLLLDRIGIKWIMRVCAVLWSLFTFLTAVANGMALVMIARVLLGLAEAPAFPAAAKASGYWFPFRERGIATSSFDSASRFSNVIGAPLIALAITSWGWRGGFYFTGILSTLFAIAWWIWYRNPREHRRISAEELAYITESGGAQEDSPSPDGIWRTTGALLRNRKIIGLFFGYGLNGFAAAFLITWLPGYMEDELHLSVLSTGLYSAIPWIFATLVDIFISGMLVDHLIKKGHDPSRIRRIFITIGVVISISIVFIAFTHTASTAVIFITTATCGTIIMSSVVWSLPAILAPTGSVGTVGGIINLANWGFNTLSTMLTGFIVAATGSFSLVIVIAAFCFAASLYFFWFFIGPFEQIVLKAPDRAPALQVKEPQ